MKRSHGPKSDATGREPPRPRTGWRIGARITATALALSRAGCSHITTDVGAPVPPRASAGLTVGTSTIANVVRGLGPPAQMSALGGGGCTMLYEHHLVTENQIGFNIPYGALKYFKFVFARATLSHQCWTMTFDSCGILRAWGEERRDGPFGSGFAVQILVASEGLVDTSAVSRPATQHKWGQDCLNPLPQALNEAQSLTSGASGLEQKLTPVGVGQHAPEMTAE